MKYKYVIGIDEVGRGPLAGPVCVCAVAMPFDKYEKSKASLWKIGKTVLTDSKKMTKIGRELWMERLRDLKNKKQIAVAIAYKSAKEIDKKGISFCIKDCIEKNLKNLNIRYDECQILLDGSLSAPMQYKNQKTIIKGDLKEKIISMASVFAKVSRDALMNKFGKKFPEYGWMENKGYGTEGHTRAIKKFGITDLHRKSFLTRIIDKVNI